MLAKFQILSVRDKRILIIGGVSLALILLYLIIFAPISHYKSSLLSEARNQQHLLSLLTQAQHQSKTLVHRHINSATKQASLSANVQKSLEIENIKPDKLAINDDKVTVYFNNISFDQLISWIIALHSHYQLEVFDAIINRKPVVGKVSATIIVEK